MKKNIISRMKSKKAQLAAGALAVILAMFPGGANAQAIPYDIRTLGQQNHTAGTILIGAGGAQGETPSGLPGFYFADQAADPNYMRMIWNSGGAIRVATYVGDDGSWNPRRYPTLGGHAYMQADRTVSESGPGWTGGRTTYDTSLTFQNYDGGAETGGVILVTNGTYGIYGEHRSVLYRWKINDAGNGFDRQYKDVDSYIYFKNNQSTNGGAIAVTNGTLNLQRVLFGDNKATGTRGLGGAIMNDQGGTINLNETSFGNSFYYPSFAATYDITAYQTAYDAAYYPIYDPIFAANYTAADYQAGGTVYNNIYDSIYNPAYDVARAAAVAQATSNAISNGLDPSDPGVAAGIALIGDNAGQQAALLAVNAEYLDADGNPVEKPDGTNMTVVEGRASNADTIAYANAVRLGHNAADGPASVAGTVAAAASVGAANAAAAVGGNIAWRGGAIHNAGVINTAGDNNAGHGVLGSSFYGNIATEFGGAIFNEHTGTINILAGFYENTAVVSGGGIYNLGNVTLRHGSRLEDNRALQVKGIGRDANAPGNGIDIATDDALGGGIFNDQGGTVNLVGTYLARNIAGERYHWIEPNPGEFVRVYEGVYDGLGGGTYNKGVLNLQSVTYEQNKARLGGAIYNLGNITSTGSSAFVTNFAQEDGGAIYFEGGESSFSDASFTRNDALRQGGAIYNKTAKVTIGSGNFQFNDAAEGGAIYNYFGQMTINSGSFTDNEATQIGGAIVVETNGVMTIGDGTFTRNTAGVDGGAIYTNRGATLNLTDIIATENKVLNWATTGLGGFMYNGLNGTVTINSNAKINEFTKNQAFEGGAFYNAVDATLSITNAKFDQNNAGQFGGAVFNVARGTISITDGFFTTNTALSGGAIYNEAGTRNAGSATLTNVEFLTNKATAGDGGAIYNKMDGVVTINTGTFTTNTATGDGGAIYNDKAQYDAQGKLVQQAGVVEITDGTFKLNSATDGGAIMNYGELSIDGTNFADNKASHYGGAIYNAIDDSYVNPQGVKIVSQPGGYLTVKDVLFSQNEAVLGGAIYNAQRETTLVGGVETDLVQIIGGHFERNKASGTGGGAVYNAANLNAVGDTVGGKMTFDGTDFTWNEAARGAGIYNDTNGVITLTDVSFTDNNASLTDAANNNVQLGGAIYNNSATINLNVVAKDSQFGKFVGDSDNIYFVGANNDADKGLANIFNVNVENTDYSLIMKGGGMASAAGAEVGITKTGIGKWQFEGKSYFGAGSKVEFDLKEGTLAMAKEAVLDLGDTGIITAFEGTTIDATGTVFTFSTSPDGSGLVIDESRIAAQQLVINGATEIIAKEFNFKPTTGKPDPWDNVQRGVNFEIVTAAATQSGEGPYLTLTLDDPTTSAPIVVGSDIYVSMPTFDIGSGGHLVLFETNGTYTGTTGTLYVNNVAAQPFERTEVPGSTYLGLAVGAEYGNYSQIVLTMINTSAKSVDLTWTGRVDNDWIHDALTLPLPIKENWSGTVGGHQVDVFMNNDDVLFADKYTDFNGAEHTLALADKTVNVLSSAGTSGVTVGSMNVTGTDYTFNLTGGNITANGNGTSTGNIDFGTAKIVNGTIDRLITAGGTITFNGRNGFEFDLNGADDGDTMLTLQTNNGANDGVVGTIGDGRIDVSYLPPDPIGLGEEIVLIDTGSSGVVTNSGQLWVNGAQQNLVREENPLLATTVLGMIARNENGDQVADGTGTQLVLTQVKTDTNSGNLTWSGAAGYANPVWDINTTRNWNGTVGGHIVDTFLNGDTVWFADRLNDGTLVTNKTVRPDAGGVEVAGLTVTGNSFTFELTNGGIESTGDLDFGAADIRNIHDFAGATPGDPAIPAIVAAGDIFFGKDPGDGTPRSGAMSLGFTGAATIDAGGNIDFADVNFGTAAQSIVLGTALNAGGTINVSGGNEFRFNLTGALEGNTILTFNAANNGAGSGVTGTVGNGNIYVTNVDLTQLNTDADEFILIDTGTDGVVSTGKLFVNGSSIVFNRDPNSTNKVLGLDTDATQSQLLLKMVQENASSADLTWTGAIDGDWNVNTTRNWYGTVKGHDVFTFLNDDTVKFTDTYVDETGNTQTVGNKYVTVVAGGVTVGNMNVTGSGYTFDLTTGGILARPNTDTGALGDISFGSGSNNLVRLATGTSISAARDIDFGTTSVTGISNSAITAGRNIGFGVDPGTGTRSGAGSLEFTAAARINATAGNIDFADASIGTATGAIRNGSTVNAGGTITFGAGSVMYFDTADATAASKYLTLTSGAGGVINVTSDIYITTLNNPIAYNEQVILVETTNGTLTQTGTLYVDGVAPPPFERSETPGDYFLGVEVVNANTAIALHMVDKSTNTDAFSPLVWTGQNTPANNGVWDINTTTAWDGIIAGNNVNTFLNGDTVLFDNTAAANRRTVNVAAGGVTVGDMTVTGSGYVFNLANGGITATINAVTNSNGNIAFGASAIKGISGDAITAGGDISFGAGNLEFTGAATIQADGDVNLANVTFGTTIVNNATGSIVAGTVVTAGGAITLDGGNIFNFDLTDVLPNGNQAMLTLDAMLGVTGAIGDGNVYVYNLYENFGDNDKIILVDAGFGSTIVDTGTLYLNGQEVKYERGKMIPGLAAENGQLLLTMVDTNGVSTDLRWSGATNGVWDVNTTKNWAGSVDGHFVDTFVNNDTVEFADGYTDKDGNPQLVATPRKNVTVAAGGVTVGDMTVTGNGYTFNLIDGGITAVENLNTGATGSIDFGSASVSNVSSTTKIDAEGNINFDGVAGQTIGVTIGVSKDDPVIVAGGNINLGNATLNIDGYTGNYGDAPVTVIQAGGALTGFTDFVVRDEDFIYVEAFNDPQNNPNAVKVATELTWYSENPNRPAHGTFTLGEGDSFTLGTALNDNLGPNTDPNWPGTELTKNGEGTLILTGNNTYSGGTTINDGRLVAGHINALGTGAVQNDSELEIAAAGNFDNVINGTGTVIANAGDGKTTELSQANSYTGDTTVQSGTLAITNILGAGANDATKTVDINAGAAFDLAFAGANVDPCAVVGGTAYNQMITGEGVLIKSGAGTIILTNVNTHSGGTVVKNGAIIVDNVASLGSGNVTVDQDADFTIGIGGTTAFAKAISGAGDVYINPARTGATQTILSGNSDYTGNTIVCSGTATLKHINASGRNASLSDNGGYVELRTGTVLDFAVGGNYYKEIKEVAGAAGSVLMTGNGKLSLWNANSYTGGTKIEGGELVARDMKAVGTGTVDLAGGNFSVLVDATGSAANRTFTNFIDGEGNVSFGTTSGTLIIDRRNDYSGVTTISQGSVELKDLLGTGLNDGKAVRIEDGATLLVTAEGDYFKGITGSGTLEKDSVGTLKLMGNNSNFTGTMHLVNGTTVLDNNRALGDDTSVVMEDSTVLKFNSSMDTAANFTLVDGEVFLDTDGNDTYVTLDGLIDGNAWLNKEGAGTLELTDANNSFSRLYINAGKLVAADQNALGNGKITNNAILELIVNKDVTLRGDIDSRNGTFIKSGEGKLNMGTSYSPFVANQFVMNGGVLEVQLSVGDKYYVQAANFSETKSSEIIGTYNSTDGINRGEERAVRFLALDGAGSGGFSKYTFNSNITRLNGRDVVDGDKLFFELWLESFSNAYGDGLSYNAGQAANAADELAEDNPLRKILEAYENNGGDMKKAFSSLHGEVYKASIAATADLQRNYNDLLLERRLLCEHCREFKQFRGQYAGTVQRELWATFTGGGNFRTEFDRFSGYNIGRWGIAGGMEHNFARGFFTGVSLGYDQADLDMSDLPQKDQFYAFRVAAYGNYTIDDVSIFGQIGYSKNWHDVERNIDFLGAKSRAKYDDDVITMGLDVAKTYHWQNINIIPSIGFTYINLRTPLIEESRADVANLYVNKHRYESFRVPLGARFNSNFNVQGVNFKPEFRAFYSYEMSDDKVRGTTAFASDATNTFLVDSGIRGRSSFRLGLGMQAELFDFLSVGVDYNAEIWSKYTRHDVGGNVKVRW